MQKVLRLISMAKPRKEQWQNTKWDSKSNGTILTVKWKLMRKYILSSNVVVEYIESFIREVSGSISVQRSAMSLYVQESAETLPSNYPVARTLLHLAIHFSLIAMSLQAINLATETVAK